MTTRIWRVTIVPPPDHATLTLTQVKRVATWEEVGDIRKLYPDCRVIADEIMVEPRFDPLAPRPVDFKDVAAVFRLVDSKRTRGYFERAARARRKEAEILDWLWPEDRNPSPEPGK